MRILLWLILSWILVACVRRPEAIAPLASRLSSYQPNPLPNALPPVVALPQPLPRAVAVLDSAATTAIYEQAYQEITQMLDGRYPLSFKRAVFVTENAYLGNHLSYERFDRRIAGLAQLCRLLRAATESSLRYSEKDKEDVARNAAIFQLLKDTVRLTDGRALVPFRYDFEDFAGERDWSRMFVNKLLATHTGNCHSLPFLYKILADEIGATTWLALAPNHIYLKQRNRQQGWYNTELTSFTFPVDAWLMASGYISKETVVSGIYMDTLSTKQSVALCLVDLAKGYERRVGRTASAGLATRCAELALHYFPTCIGAQLLQAELLRLQYEHQTTPAGARAAYSAMEIAYTRIFQTGYREMPAQLYADWLQSARSEQSPSLKKP